MSRTKINPSQKPSIPSIVCPKCGHCFPLPKVELDLFIKGPSCEPRCIECKQPITGEPCPSAVGSLVNRALLPTTSPKAWTSWRRKCGTESIRPHAGCGGNRCPLIACQSSFGHTRSKSRSGPNVHRRQIKRCLHAGQSALCSPTGGTIYASPKCTDTASRRRPASHPIC
jgi:hypothetical protein